MHKSMKVWLVCSYMHNFCSNAVTNLKTVVQSVFVCTSYALSTCSHMHIHMHTTASSFEYLDARIDALTEPCVAELERQGFKRY